MERQGPSAPHPRNARPSAALTTAMGGTVARDDEAETYTRTLKCHHSNGEIYSSHSAATRRARYVNVIQESITVGVEFELGWEVRWTSFRKMFDVPDVASQD